MVSTKHSPTSLSIKIVEDYNTETANSRLADFLLRFNLCTIQLTDLSVQLDVIGQIGQTITKWHKNAHPKSCLMSLLCLIYFPFLWTLATIQLLSTTIIFLEFWIKVLELFNVCIWILTLYIFFHFTFLYKVM